MEGETRLILFTIGTAALAVLIALPFALGLGWVLARRSWPGKSLVEALAMMPLAMPPVATGLILLKLFGNRGPLGGWLQEHWGIAIIFTWKAVVLTLSVMAFPLLLRSIRTAFEELPPMLEEVAATLGKRPRLVFLRISLPLARRGIAAGVVLGFARALGEFGATVMVAGFIPGVTETLPLAIYRNFQAGHDSEAWSLAAIGTVIAFIAVYAANLLTKKRI